MPMVTEMDDVIESLLAPISGASPAGVFDAEDELYLAIDLEMVKLGGLHAATLDWSFVESSAIHYLQARCKHFRILGHLMSAWLRHQQWQGWIRSIQLLAGMTELHWTSLFPQPGPTGLSARKRLYTALGQRLLQSLKHLQPDSHTGAGATQATEAVAALQRAERHHTIGASVAALLLPALERAIEHAERAPFQPPRPTRSASPQPVRDALGKEFFSASRELPLGNEREIRAACLKLADHINQQDGFDPTGYLLRRRALWAGIHGTPPARADGRTEMMNVPADISIEYQDALMGGPCSPALLMRIERSVASCPYWLRGSFLSASIAQRLEMPMVAVVIRSAVGRFAQRLPMLRDLLFSDGSPFIDAETLGWIGGDDDSDRCGVAGKAVTLARMHAELLDQQKDGQSMESILLGLQARRPGKQSLRERAYSSAAAADLFHARGLASLAQDLYAGVAQTMSSHAANEWEPDLFSHVTARSGRSEAGQ